MKISYEEEHQIPVKKDKKVKILSKQYNPNIFCKFDIINLYNKFIVDKRKVKAHEVIQIEGVEVHFPFKPYDSQKKFMKQGKFY